MRFIVKNFIFFLSLNFNSFSNNTITIQNNTNAALQIQLGLFNKGWQNTITVAANAENTIDTGIYCVDDIKINGIDQKPGKLPYSFCPALITIAADQQNPGAFSVDYIIGGGTSSMGQMPMTISCYDFGQNKAVLTNPSGNAVVGFGNVIDNCCNGSYNYPAVMLCYFTSKMSELIKANETILTKNYQYSLISQQVKKSYEQKCNIGSFKDYHQCSLKNYTNARNSCTSSCSDSLSKECISCIQGYIKQTCETSDIKAEATKCMAQIMADTGVINDLNIIANTLNNIAQMQQDMATFITKHGKDVNPVLSNLTFETKNILFEGEKPCANDQPLEGQLPCSISYNVIKDWDTIKDTYNTEVNKFFTQTQNIFKFCPRKPTFMDEWGDLINTLTAFVGLFFSIGELPQLIIFAASSILNVISQALQQQQANLVADITETLNLAQ